MIRVCFAWRDGLRPIERAYVRHPQFHFYSSATTGSNGHMKLLLPLSSDGRWSRVAPMPLASAHLRLFRAAPPVAETEVPLPWKCSVASSTAMDVQVLAERAHEEHAARETEAPARRLAEDARKEVEPGYMLLPAAIPSSCSLADVAIRGSAE